MASLKPPSGAGKWTVQELKGIDPSSHKQEISDGSGLSGRVWASAKGISISFRYGYRWGTERRWYQCGAWPETSLSAIRERRDAAKALVRNKQEPNESKRAEQIQYEQRITQAIEQQKKQQAAELTVADLFKVWIVLGIAHKDGNKEVSRQLTKYVLPTIGKVKLSEVSENSLQDLYRAIEASGHTRTLTIIIRLIKQMLTWAERRNPWRQLLIEGNPANLIDPQQFIPHDYSGTRSRILSTDEIKEIHKRFRFVEQAYQSSGNKRNAQRPLIKTTEIAVWICLSTLCRIGELSKAEWKDVDLENRTWTIPAKNVKAHRGQGRTHIVHLSSFAVKQLRALKVMTGNTPWLFPSEKLGYPISPGTFAKQIGDRQKCFSKSKGKRNRAQSDLLGVGSEKWTLHDLRRTGSTTMAKLGISREIINLCQNHLVGSSIDRHYLHHDFWDKKSEAWNQLGRELQSLLPTNITSLHSVTKANKPTESVHKLNIEPSRFTA